MNKCLFIVQHAVDARTGIGKKIIAQCETFNRLGIETELSSLVLDGRNKYCARTLPGEPLEKFEKYLFIEKRFNWFWSYKKLSEYIKSKNINYIYIRYTHFANPFFINFLEDIKSFGVKIYIELPTYPYDAEYRSVGFMRSIYKNIERIYRWNMHNFIEKIITYSDDDQIFNAKTIKLSNGIDVNKIPLKKKNIEKFGQLDICTISSLEYWHGYDRLIEGYFLYAEKNPKLNIRLHFAGPKNSDLQKKYTPIIEEKGLSENIIFHGYLNGQPLDCLVDKSDFAVSVLGGHRKGLNKLCALKSREYCARGIPFIYSGSDEAFDDKDYVLRIPHDESPVDFAKAINWFRQLTNTRSRMRKFSIDNLSWEAQLVRVTREMKE